MLIKKALREIILFNLTIATLNNQEKEVKTISKAIYEVREARLPTGKKFYTPVRELQEYNYRIVESGDVIEVYKYKEKIYYNYEQFENNNHTKDKTEEWKGKEEFSLSRARREIRRVVWANKNKYSKFLTLTYKDNMQDKEIFYKDFQIFITALKRKGHKLNYLYVLEYQERGAIHCHIILFNNEYIPWQTIKDCWKKGSIDIHRIRDIKNLGAYVCKYLTKETIAEYNSKSYHCSQGLNRPIESKITQSEGETHLKELLSKYELKYTTEYNITINEITTNSVNYYQYIRSIPQ